MITESTPGTWIATTPEFFSDDEGCFSGQVETQAPNANYRVRAVLSTDEFKILKRTKAWDIVFGFATIDQSGDAFLDFGDLVLRRPEGLVFDIEIEAINAALLWLSVVELKEDYTRNIGEWDPNFPSPLKFRYRKELAS